MSAEPGIQMFPVETLDGAVRVVAHNATYPPAVLRGTSGPWYELVFGDDGGYHVLTQAEAEQLAMALISATASARVRRG